MSTNLEKLHQAGIVGVPHVITPDDEDAINSLSDAEVNALISAKSKLSAPFGECNQRRGCSASSRNCELLRRIGSRRQLRLRRAASSYAQFAMHGDRNDLKQ